MDFGQTARMTREEAGEDGERADDLYSPGFPGAAEQSRAEQSRAEQSRAEQSRAEQSRAEQSRAEQSRPSSPREWVYVCDFLETHSVFWLVPVEDKYMLINSSRTSSRKSALVVVMYQQAPGPTAGFGEWTGFSGASHSTPSKVSPELQIW
ncbi:uncharacterized protein PG986_003015 [Apiospora aurea]|uniref:Uncharacterized protein n=1 Tax=Apiospora aurea TaxID=335848 RepID=A0ABR1QQG7_9PEZI